MYVKKKNHKSKNKIEEKTGKEKHYHLMIKSGACSCKMMSKAQPCHIKPRKRRGEVDSPYGFGK